MATLWKLDPSHSELTFQVKHMMISKVKGEFRTFDAEIMTNDETFTNATIKVTVKTDSIDTNNADRDIHLKWWDFFNIEQYPEITFESTTFNGDVEGSLTMNGITKPVVLVVEFGGVNVDPWWNTKAWFSFQTELKRSDFGLSWNAVLETWGVLVSDEVKILGEVQFVKQS